MELERENIKSVHKEARLARQQRHSEIRNKHSIHKQPPKEKPVHSIHGAVDKAKSSSSSLTKIFKKDKSKSIMDKSQQQYQQF